MLYSENSKDRRQVHAQLTTMMDTPLFHICSLATALVNAEILETRSALVQSGNSVAARVKTCRSKLSQGEWRYSCQRRTRRPTPQGRTAKSPRTAPLTSGGEQRGVFPLLIRCVQRTVSCSFFKGELPCASLFSHC